MKRVCDGCGDLIEASAGHLCDDCQRQRWSAMPSRTARGYSHRWQLLSKRYRRRVPYCEIRGPGCQRVAVDTDHKVPVRAGGRAVWANCQSVCRVCHVRKTREDATTTRRAGS